MVATVEQIEGKIDRVVSGAVTISNEVGGISFSTMGEVMEFAKMMAVAGVAVPPHLRQNPGACLAVCIQALEWRMSPFAVANKSYSVQNRGVERIAYESQLITAIVEARAPTKGRLRHEIVGEGDERRCKVWATFKGETEPHVYVSETLKHLRDARGRNEQGQIKGSPLWDTQPNVQLYYSASRQWARLYCSDVILGIYAKDELEDEGGMVDVTPKVSAMAQRLKDAKATHGGETRGFNADHVHREAEAQSGNSIIEGEAQRDTTKAESEDGKEETGDAGGHDAGLRDGAGSADSASAGETDGAVAGAGDDRPTQQDAGTVAGDEKPEQGKIFPADRDDPNFPKPKRRK